MIAEITIRRIKTKQWFRTQILPRKRCRCGEADPACLDFHHKNPKTRKHKVSRLVDCAFSRTIILLEVRKCVVLCANCHRKYHHKRKLNGNLLRKIMSYYSGRTTCMLYVVDQFESFSSAVRLIHRPVGPVEPSADGSDQLNCAGITMGPTGTGARDSSSANDLKAASTRSVITNVSPKI